MGGKKWHIQVPRREGCEILGWVGCQGLLYSLPLKVSKWRLGSSHLGHMEMDYLDEGHGLYGEGSGNPLQYSCLENSMDRGTWKAAWSPWGHKSCIRLSD